MKRFLALGLLVLPFSLPSIDSVRSNFIAYYSGGATVHVTMPPLAAHRRATRH